MNHKMLVSNLNNLYNKYWSRPARDDNYSTAIQHFFARPAHLPKYSSIAEYADVKAIFSVHKNPLTVFDYFQFHLLKIELWYQNWKIKINISKSCHITFTL